MTSDLLNFAAGCSSRSDLVPLLGADDSDPADDQGLAPSSEAIPFRLMA
ncbi:hypothetical protein MITS9509_02544 [Synechococcus sp. MIT S9509]|nr:hypothetical protein MITS9504_02356 [Synechococcus sp. MIT S9504]KZR91315.1 hypothetical protein MITS9509_02544 [Synechococcus sp. MIT S9509]